jgi:hypothetical protein
MAPKISKTKPPETKPAEPVDNESLALHHLAHGLGPTPLPTEEEQEALRVSLRDSVSGTPVESFGNGDTVVFDAPTPAQEAEDDSTEQAARDREAARREAFLASHRASQEAAVRAFEPPPASLSHGYPPHNPGEGIQSQFDASAVGGAGTSPIRLRKPTVGRIVLFASDAYPEPQAAIITRVHNYAEVDLTVFRAPMDPMATATSDDQERAKGKPISGYKVAEGAVNGIGRRWFWPPVE